MTLLNPQAIMPDEKRFLQQVELIFSNIFVLHIQTLFLVAVTFKEKYGPGSISCADMFPKYLPHCKHYGNGYYGEGLGACVKDDVDDCPPKRTPPLTWN